MKTKVKYNLRVWRVTNFDGDRGSNHFYVDTPQEGARLIHALAELDLQSEEITENAFGMEEYVDGEWLEWEDDNGDSVDALVDEYEDYLEVVEEK